MPLISIIPILLCLFGVQFYGDRNSNLLHELWNFLFVFLFRELFDS